MGDSVIARRRVGWRVGALLAAAAAGCFHADFLAYAPCRDSEPCRAAGLRACVVLPELGAQPGYCAGACEADGDCPSGQTGDAAPRCLAVADASVCGLDCSAGTCPEGYVCLAVADAADAALALCFPEDAE